MASHGPAVLRDYCHQLEFDFIRIIRLSPAQTVGESFHVGVYGNGLLTIGVAQDDIGRFPAYSRKSSEFFQRAGNPPLELLDDHLAAAGHIFGLIMVKTCRADFFFEGFKVGPGEICGVMVFSEKILGDQIHPFIRTLSG